MMRSKSINSHRREKGRSINGDVIEVDTWVSNLLTGKKGRPTNTATRIRIGYNRLQVYKNISYHIILAAVSLSIPIYFLTTITRYWYALYSLVAVYTVIVLTTSMLFEEVVVIHGQVIQTAVKYVCWPVTYKAYLCQNVDFVCMNEGFRRQRVIFYLMLVMKALVEKEKEHVVVFENTLPSLAVLQPVLDEMRRAISDIDN